MPQRPGSRARRVRWYRRDRAITGTQGAGAYDCEQQRALLVLRLRGRDATQGVQQRSQPLQLHVQEGPGQATLRRLLRAQRCLQVGAVGVQACGQKRPGTRALRTAFRSSRRLCLEAVQVAEDCQQLPGLAADSGQQRRIQRVLVHVLEERAAPLHAQPLQTHQLQVLRHQLRQTLPAAAQRHQQPAQRGGSGGQQGGVLHYAGRVQPGHRGAPAQRHVLPLGEQESRQRAAARQPHALKSALQQQLRERLRHRRGRGQGLHGLRTGAAHEAFQHRHALIAADSRGPR
mmetsp:Transcript_7988/g.17455  ORF Transcript_7988/g.17455 Transcript_7988/m.17455 type:complete len:288 (+) Transcript_7988:1911-2774(+)